jgi:hypothetical protein
LVALINATPREFGDGYYEESRDFFLGGWIHHMRNYLSTASEEAFKAYDEVGEEKLNTVI